MDKESLLSAGYTALFETLDYIDAERFIVEVKRGYFDLSDRQKQALYNMSPEELHEIIDDYAREHKAPAENTGNE